MQNKKARQRRAFYLNNDLTKSMILEKKSFTLSKKLCPSSDPKKADTWSFALFNWLPTWFQSILRFFILSNNATKLSNCSSVNVIPS